MTRTVQQLFDLSGKTALVTGGSRGLGLQLAQSLGEAGAKVLLSSRKAADLEESVAVLKKAGIDAQFIPADCADEHDIQRLGAASMKALGHVDILVNNAGAAWGAPAEDHPMDAWDKLVNLNMSGMFLLSQIIAKRSMIPAKWGRIINIASVNGLQATDMRLLKNAAYVATKHGVVGLTRQLATEWGCHGITVNAICPGFFPSKMTKSTLDTAGEFVKQATPTGRLGNDEDLMGLTVLLASEASRHITGQAIAVDGGSTII